VDKKVKILFTATFSTSFIQEDLKILNSHFSVSKVISSGIKTIYTYISTIRSNDITFSWFASVYSSILIFFTKIFRKKSILILGGVDVAKIPELNYGIWNSWWKSIIVRYGIINADIVLAVDSSIKNDAVKLARYHGNNIFVLPTGHDSSFWQPKQVKENFVLTVANCDNNTRFKIKGIDFLYTVAQSLPNVHFVLIGMSPKMQKQLFPPSNLEIYDSKSQTDLLDFYQRAKVYFQPSLREALGSTLCEAMLCGCYPIGTNVGGIPTVIGNTGSIIPFGNTDTAVKEITKGLQTQPSLQAREQIMTFFSIEQREQKIIKYISQLLHD
jgi:glycosyltransferase involved in cell wall biosynthesis